MRYGLIVWSRHFSCKCLALYHLLSVARGKKRHFILSAFVTGRLSVDLAVRLSVWLAVWLVGCILDSSSPTQVSTCSNLEETGLKINLYLKFSHRKSAIPLRPLTFPSHTQTTYIVCIDLFTTTTRLPPASMYTLDSRFTSPAWRHEPRVSQLSSSNTRFALTCQSQVTATVYTNQDGKYSCRVPTRLTQNYCALFKSFTTCT